MKRPSMFSVSLLLASAASVVGQQQCYYGPGAELRGPSNLVPCQDGESACCLLGDTCLSGNTCYNYATGDLYQYGCTDITYNDASCPYKCGWNTTKSPWTALEYCTDLSGVQDTWTCHTPETCGCDWQPSYDLQILAPRGCKQMGKLARVALYAPSVLVPYVSLPTKIGESSTYYSTYSTSGTWTWVSTAIANYTPSSIGPFTTYKTPAPNKIVQIDPGVTPAPSTLPAAHALNVSVTAESNGANPNLGSTSSSTSSTTSTHTHTHTHSATPTPSPGLSTDAKIGIGVGIAGGVLFLAAIALVFFVLRKRKNKAQQQPEKTDEIQGGGFNEKSPGWQGQNYPGGVFQDPHHSNPPYYSPPPQIYEAPSPPQDEYAFKRMSPAPVEMEGHFEPAEMETPNATSEEGPSQPK